MLDLTAQNPKRTCYAKQTVLIRINEEESGQQCNEINSHFESYCMILVQLQSEK